MSSWEKGYGDFVMRPDLDTLRLVPWQEGTALCLADLEWADGSDVVASPRQVLRAQLARLAERGWSANASTELEFLVFRDTYEDAWRKGYRDLEPANLYNVDYSLLGTARVEPLIRRIRNAMTGAGLAVENSKGECNFGQHEINFRYARRAAHRRRALDLQERRQGDRRPGGDGDQLHGEVQRARGQLVPHPLLARRRRRRRRVFAATARRSTSFLAGQLACLRELTLFLAPNVNSYKRYAAGSFAPDRRRLGARTTAPARCASSGTAPALRFENRAGGSDLNPYLALSALIAAGLHGVEHGLELEPPYQGNAYLAHDKPRLPGDAARRARPVRRAASVARAAFGDEVVDHYANAADVELAAFDAAVTDWERFRGFERL